MKDLALSFIGLCIASTIIIILLRTWFPEQCVPPYCTASIPLRD